MSRRFKVGAGFVALRAWLQAADDVKTLDWRKSHELWVGVVFAALMTLVAFGVVDFGSDEAQALAGEAATAIVSIIGFVVMILLRRYTSTKPLGPKTEKAPPAEPPADAEPPPPPEPHRGTRHPARRR